MKLLLAEYDGSEESEGKNMKRYLKITALMILLALISAGFLSACGGSGGSSGTEGEAEWPAMDKLNGLTASDITSIQYSRATEGGVQEDRTGDPTEIEDIYLRLKDITVADKTDEAFEDDDMYITVEAGDENIEFSFMGDILILEGDNYKVDNLSSLKSYIDGLLENAAGPKEDRQDTTGGGNTTGSNDPTAGSADYDVSKGFEKKSWNDMEILYFNDFMITMPNNDKWSYEMDGNKVIFYLYTAQQEGYGGRLVTISAYDMDDNSYEQLPMPYQVAGVGKNVNKRFVAIYPSDVQYDFNDEQQSADYMELFDYLKKIKEGASDSPLQLSDSNPE